MAHAVAFAALRSLPGWPYASVEEAMRDPLPASVIRLISIALTLGRWRIPAPPTTPMPPPIRAATRDPQQLDFKRRAAGERDDD